MKSAEDHKRSSHNENALLEARKALAVRLALVGTSSGGSQVTPDEALDVLR